jgi:hypothetical protein
LLLAQSTGGGGLAVEGDAADAGDEGDDEGDRAQADAPGEDGGCAADGDGDGGACEDSDRAESEDEDEDEDEEGDEDGGDGAGDRGVEVAPFCCATRSVAEIGRQAVMNTPMINIQRITLVITPGYSPGGDQPTPAQRVNDPPKIGYLT